MAKDFVNGEPFLLLLGDHLYVSNQMPEKSCVEQCLEAFQGKSIIAMESSEESSIGNYGCLTGQWEDDKRTIINITEIVEKPTIRYARKNLTTQSLNANSYLTCSGIYVLANRIMDLLGTDISNDSKSKGRFELTTGLEQLRREAGLKGLMVDGSRLDIGHPETYCETLAKFAQKRTTTATPKQAGRQESGPNLQALLVQGE